MIIGSGPIIIGQACEFDYSGTQACKALKNLGYEIVLVNSNPATIMTDPQTADITYIEPLNVRRLEQIIEKERPDALLPNLGGQSGLNLCQELYKAGVLQKYGVEVIGVQVDAIERGEDRIEFKETMNRLGIEMARSEPAYSVDEALAIAEKLGYPVVVRPAYTMGGAGGGLVYNVEELRTVAGRGIAASLIGQVLIEESVLGWEELELEVVRDSKDQLITVCFIENVDPMGVHTGDSFCTAPMLTISREVQQRLQEAAYKVVREVQVIGGCNCQFAHDPVSDRIVIIEINPRTSRSSALASKATGFPIALISSMLAAGLTLDEIPYHGGGSLADYQPGGDYVVVKFARWAFEKFKDSEDRLGTQMKAVGEVMSIGRTFKEAFQKAIRSLENGRYGLGHIRKLASLSLEELYSRMATPTSERHFIIYAALMRGGDVDKICSVTRIKRYFIEEMARLAAQEEALSSLTGSIAPDMLRAAKRDGFSDRYLSLLTGRKETEIRRLRIENGIVPGFDVIDVSGVENARYYYSTYHLPPSQKPDNGKKRILILGSGPNRIGQGIEFDYCCVHAALALRGLGFETIIINCNPETVSTDYDTSDRLYFEPLTVEDVLTVYDLERPLGVIAQFGGQTPLNIINDLRDAGVSILGTSPETIDLAEDRDLFRAMMDKLEIPMPQSEMVSSVSEALTAAAKIGYPLMVRPSFVLGGRGMEVVRSDEELTGYMNAAGDLSPDRPILADRFLENALECEADAVCDGEHAFVPAVMEHIELAGIHSGDSACILPSKNIPEKHLATIREYTKKIAVEMNVRGLMNMQYAICGDTVYVLEANPRASRTVPLVSKVCNIQMVRLATDIVTAPLTGRPSPVPDLRPRAFSHCGVKEAVFPFNMFPEVDPILGPEMRSTGEVLGLADDFGTAFYKSQEAAGLTLPESGNVFISVNDGDKEGILDAAKGFVRMGFTIYATEGTHAFLAANGVESRPVCKLGEGRPNVLDLITNKTICAVFNTPIGRQSAEDDSYIRKAAIKHKICYMTTIAAARASVEGIEAHRQGTGKTVKSLQEYHSQIR